MPLAQDDFERASAEYSFDRTQHGRFKVHEYNATDPDIGADYITVHFLLDSPEFPDAEVYVDGEFAHGHYDASNLMTYDRGLGAYTAAIPLKQGPNTFCTGRRARAPTGSCRRPCSYRKPLTFTR